MGGNTKGIEASQGISVIAGSGFMGFLLGPVILGFLASYSNLKLSFIALLGFTLASLWLAIRLKK
jgi:hypothetical protein